MPPRKRVEATVYIIDCASNVKERLKLLKKIHFAKIFAQTSGASQDIRKVILFNHPGLKSIHIVEKWEYYSFNLFDTIKKQITEAVLDYKPRNFLYALNAAISTFEEDLVENHYVRRIIFITDLSSNMDFDENTSGRIGVLKTELKSQEAWLYVIGLNVKVPKLCTQTDIKTLNKIEPSHDLSPEQKKNYSILSQFHHNVVYADEENGFNIIFAHKVKPKGTYAWYVKMNIGPDLEIPIMACKTCKNKEAVHFLPSVSATGERIDSTKIWIDTNTLEEVQESDVVKAFKFHGQLMHLSAAQMQDPKKDEWKKCLTIFGFANADQVPVNLFILSETMHCIRPDLRGPKSAADRRFALFVAGLRVKNSVALAYRCYNDRNYPKFFVIFPCPEHKNDRHLLMGQLPFQHEFHEGFFRGTVDETNYNSDTYNLMSDFLDNLSPFDKEKDKELYPLPPSMQISDSRIQMVQYLGAKAVGDDLPGPHEMTMHPVIEERACGSLDALLQECLLN